MLGAGEDIKELKPGKQPQKIKLSTVIETYAGGAMEARGEGQRTFLEYAMQAKFQRKRKC